MTRRRKDAAGPPAARPDPGGAWARWGRALLFATLLACPLVFSTSTLEAFEFPKVLLLRGVALVFGVAGLAALATTGRTGLRPWREEPVPWAMLAVLAAGAASCATSVSPLTSWRGGHETFAGLLTLASFAVIFFAARGLCREPRHFRELLPAVGLATAGSSGYALLQAAGLDPIRWTGTHEFLGLSRSQGTLGNPTFLGGYLAVALPLVAFLVLDAARRRAWPAALAWALVALVGLGGLGVTLARGAWLAAGCGAAVAAAGAFGTAPSPAARRRLALAGLALALVAALGVALSPPARRVVAAMARRVVLTLQARPQERPGAGISYREEPRLELWRVALALWRDHPALGVGLDAFQLGYPRHRSLEVWRVAGHRTPQNAHNELLQTLATQGAVGGLALLALVAALLTGLGAAWRRAPAERLLLSAAAGSLAAAAVHLSFSLTVAALALMLAFLAALVSRLGREADERPAAPAAARFPAAALLVAGAALLAPLEWALVLRPWRADLAARAAQVAEAGRVGEGLPWLRRAVGLDPGRDLLWSRLGAAAFGLASELREGPPRAAFLAEARAAFDHATALVPVNAYHHLGLARVLLEQALSRPPAASPVEVWAAFDQALALDPRNPYLAAEDGRTALRLGDAARVRAAAARCQAADDQFGACEWLLANLDISAALAAGAPADERVRLLAQAGERLKRAASLRWYDDDSAQALAASQGAAALVSAGRLQEGKDLAELAVQKDPRFPDARYNLGKAWERLGDRERAARSYRDALAIAPGHAEAAAALAALRARDEAP